MEFCNKCNNTGATTPEGFLDCTAPLCTAAQDRANLDKWMLREGYGQSGIREWAIHQYAVRTAVESASMLLNEKERLEIVIQDLRRRVDTMALELAARQPLADSFVAPSVKQLAAQLNSDETWTIAEQKAFAPFLAQFPNECSKGIISLGSAWKHGAAYTASAMAAAVDDARKSSCIDPSEICIVGRAHDGKTPDIDLPIFGDGSKDGKRLFVVALPAPQPFAVEVPPLPVVDDESPIETIEYWADAYRNHMGGGHGMIVRLLREYASLRRASQPVQQPAAARGQHALLSAIRDGVPLEEPVSVCKAMMARMPARVVLDKGEGPLAAVHLVNIGVGGWVHNMETATAYADGFNRGTEWLRSSIIEFADQMPVTAPVPAAGVQGVPLSQMICGHLLMSGKYDPVGAANEADKIVALIQPDSGRDAALVVDAETVLAELAERCSSYDPERDYGGSMELRDQYRDGDYFKVEEVQAVIRALAAHPANGAQAGDAEEDAYVIDRMGKLLAGVAIALKGPEQALHRHGYQDLVEVAQTLMLELELYRDHIGVQSCAAYDVLAERRRQIEKEGYDTAHDDEHANDEIAAYATFYAMPPAARDWPAPETGYGSTWGEAIIPANWGPAKPGDRRGELVKAGALIVAEIERLDRAAPQKKEG